jgi:hypothetical protein
MTIGIEAERERRLPLGSWSGARPWSPAPLKRRHDDPRRSRFANVRSDRLIRRRGRDLGDIFNHKLVGRSGLFRLSLEGFGGFVIFRLFRLISAVQSLDDLGLLIVNRRLGTGVRPVG